MKGDGRLERLILKVMVDVEHRSQKLKQLLHGAEIRARKVT